MANKWPRARNRNQKVFVASIEVKALPGSEMAQRRAGTGGFVYCMIPASDEEQAKVRLGQTLDEDRYELVDLEFVRLAEEVTWKTDEEAEHFNGLEKEARVENDVVYSEFYTYANLDS